MSETRGERESMGKINALAVLGIQNREKDERLRVQSARIAALEAEVKRQRDLLHDLAGDFPSNVASNAREAVKAYLAGDLDYQEALTASVRSGTQLDYAEWAEIRGITNDPITD